LRRLAASVCAASQLIDLFCSDDLGLPSRTAGSNVATCWWLTLSRFRSPQRLVNAPEEQSLWKTAAACSHIDCYLTAAASRVSPAPAARKLDSKSCGWSIRVEVSGEEGEKIWRRTGRKPHVQTGRKLSIPSQRRSSPRILTVSRMQMAPGRQRLPPIHRRESSETAYSPRRRVLAPILRMQW
jgi:hypothetical protein